MPVKKYNKDEYPRVKQLRKNSYYSGLLQNLYSGTDGEVASFLQLRYQMYHLADFNEDIAKLFEEIAISDLKHQELLANAILMVGGDPVYSNSLGIWFGGRNIDYIKDVKQMLSLNIENKEKFIIDYKTTISKIENSEIKLLLKYILSDEEEHRKKMEEVLKNIE